MTFARRPYHIFLLVLCFAYCLSRKFTTDDYLSSGDQALSTGAYQEAIDLYSSGLEQADEDESLLTVLSLETNMATALSSIGKSAEAVTHYLRTLSIYKEEIDEIVDKDVKKFARDITSQASFFLGMEYQDLNKIEQAVESYGQAILLDPNHWSALANLGSVLHDILKNIDEALAAYNKAYEILTSEDIDPTDPPAEPRFILSQLQYRIGLCLNHDLSRKCALEDDPENPVSCREMATHAFSLAVQYDPDNESAKHMLATVTADATMKRASNKYVKSLFDDYAQNFEHSLVEELGYTGYERLRFGFARAFGGEDKIPKFSTVIDAGCGTGLVGEQFRNVSTHLIGVDLSEAIIEEAQKMRPGLYDEVVVGDITEVFRDRKPLSLIVAADSYIYFGDLVPLFESMQESLDENGFVAFTLENVDAENEKALSESKPDWRWQLTPSGRFAHRKDYVVSVGKNHDLEAIHYESLDGFRYEQGKAVRGHLFVMKKTGQKGSEEL